MGITLGMVGGSCVGDDVGGGLFSFFISVDVKDERKKE